MIEDRDWMMRVIKQLGEAIAKVMFLKQQKNHDQALAVLEALFVSSIKLPTLNWSIYDSRLLDILGREGDQVALLMHIFDERAEIEWDRDNQHEALRCELMVQACEKRLVELRHPDHFADVQAADIVLE